MEMAMPRRQHIIMNWDDVPVVMDLTMAARLLGVSERHLAKQCRDGMIPAACKIGRFWRIRKDAVMQMVGLSPQ